MIPMALAVLMAVLPMHRGHAQVALPAGSVVFEPDEIRFPNLVEGKCLSRKVTVTNQSSAPIDHPGFIIDGDDNAFAIQKHFRKCPDQLQPGAQCRIYVNFCARSDQSYKAMLRFMGGDDAIPLTGKGHQTWI